MTRQTALAHIFTMIECLSDDDIAELGGGVSCLLAARAASGAPLSERGETLRARIIELTEEARFELTKSEGEPC